MFWYWNATPICSCASNWSQEAARHRYLIQWWSSSRHIDTTLDLDEIKGFDILAQFLFGWVIITHHSWSWFSAEIVTAQGGRNDGDDELDDTRDQHQGTPGSSGHYLYEDKVVYTIGCRHNAVQYTHYCSDWDRIQIRVWIHKIHPISGRCFLWRFWRNLTALQRHRTVNCWTE